MSETPSKRRRQGREAFTPLADPMEFQPYKNGSWAYQYHLEDWIDGWKEAEEAYEKAYEEAYECQRCGNPVLDYQPQLCCGGQECGCLGLPIEPCICIECWDNFYINIEN